ncbi:MULTISPECIES: helix-turn-helix domain-containing protein [unclassified Lysinibacillus]|uniref:helix-turn-helix domain-containing protein n=1 Tax=unclassified Lysinibacillus TaxID=2636778 RepID=UPI0037FBECC7
MKYNRQIFKERIQRKSTQKQLGKLAGVTQKTISSIEAGGQGVKIGTYEKVLSEVLLNVIGAMS